MFTLHLRKVVREINLALAATLKRVAGVPALALLDLASNSNNSSGPLVLMVGHR